MMMDLPGFNTSAVATPNLVYFSLTCERAILYLSGIAVVYPFSYS